MSHHVQITAPGAALVVSTCSFFLAEHRTDKRTPKVSLVNGRIAFQGTSAEFFESDGYKAIAGGDDKDDEPAAVNDHKKPVAPRKASTLTAASIAALKPKSFAQVAAQRNNSTMSTASSTEVTSASEGGDDDSDSDPTIDGDELKLHGKLLATPPEAEKKPRKLVEEEGRAVGRVSGAVWKLYLGMMGGIFFWFFFVVIFAGAKLSDVAQTWWLGVWAGACECWCCFHPTSPKANALSTSASQRPGAGSQHQLLPHPLCDPLGDRGRGRDAAVVHSLQRHFASLEQTARTPLARCPARAAPLVR